MDLADFTFLTLFLAVLYFSGRVSLLIREIAALRQQVFDANIEARDLLNQLNRRLESIPDKRDSQQ